MKTCLALVWMASALLRRVTPNKKVVADPQTNRKILALVKALDEGHNNNDPAAIAVVYTRDAVFVTPEGPIIGRQAIQKWFTDLFQWWHPKNHISASSTGMPFTC